MKNSALILGWIPRIIVPIARSLHREGVAVDVARFSFAPPICSRAICEQRSITEAHTNAEEFVQELRSFIIDRGHSMLIPSDDCMLTAVMEHYEDLAGLLHVAAPPPAITRLVLDKAATLEVARKCGVRIPRTERITTSSQLHGLIGCFPFPWVLKPAEKETRIEEVKSCVFTTADEVRSAFPKEREFTPPMLVQEYCAGAGIGVEILLDKGECVASFQHRRLKELPYTGGVSVTAVAEPVDAELLRSSLSLLLALGWDGIAMVEYKVDSAGRSFLMEVNGRYWGTISLPIQAGMDFPLYHWKLVHGQPIEIPKAYAVGTRWRWTVGYLYRLYFLVSKARSSPAARRALRENLGDASMDFSPSVKGSTFAASDPMASVVPFLRALGYFASHTVARSVDRLPIWRGTRAESALKPSQP